MELFQKSHKFCQKFGSLLVAVILHRPGKILYQNACITLDEGVQEASKAIYSLI